MTAGYAAFANLGYKITPHLIQKVEDHDGNVLYEATEKNELVLNSSLTFILNNMLTATYDSAYIDYTRKQGSDFSLISSLYILRRKIQFFLKSIVWTEWNSAKQNDN